jgi:hypothetical protein
MIQYKIEFLSEWHIGSGLGAGAAADATVLLDNKEMPYIPGKTIKGLLKDAMKDIQEVQPEKITVDDIKALFGLESNSPGVAKFSDCTLNQTDYNAIVSNEYQNAMLKNVASTAIDEFGIANDKSLRSKEVCIPLSLEGEIDNADEYKEKIALAFKWVRGAGVNRNRGLGRCKVTLIEENK